MADLTGNFVSRAGDKLNFALDHFSIDVKNLVCCDLGSSTGGFVDCLLKRGAKKVYAIDTAYGELNWGLRNNNRVVVMERTNALYVSLTEKLDFICIDLGWTPQKMVLPKAKEMLKENGVIISLIKPHYEADKSFLRGGKVLEEKLPEVLDKVKSEIIYLGLNLKEIIESPIEGKKGKNKEFLALIGFGS